MLSKRSLSIIYFEKKKEHTAIRNLVTMLAKAKTRHHMKYNSPVWHSNICKGWKKQTNIQKRSNPASYYISSWSRSHCKGGTRSSYRKSSFPSCHPLPSSAQQGRAQSCEAAERCKRPENTSRWLEGWHFHSKDDFSPSSTHWQTPARQQVAKGDIVFMGKMAWWGGEKDHLQTKFTLFIPSESLRWLVEAELSLH